MVAAAAAANEHGLVLQEPDLMAAETAAKPLQALVVQ